jgi:Flp pilus assembly protein TadD
VFWADHGTRTADAVVIARDELARRTDVYGHDALAWALLADGDAAAARAESDLALALGTRDARLLYHAGMISAALGDDDRARDELRAALDLNPHFDPLQAARAAETLEGLS